MLKFKKYNIILSKCVKVNSPVVFGCEPVGLLFIDSLRVSEVIEIYAVSFIKEKTAKNNCVL